MKKYTVIYPEQVGYNRGQTITRFRHVITDNLGKTLAKEFGSDVWFVFDGHIIPTAD